ncbi:MAG: type III polyketide synthase [Alphaproteobacteria bacterium]
MMQTPRLQSLATSLPPYILEQDEVRELARTYEGGGRSSIDRLLPVYDNAGIRKRHSCVPLQWYLEDNDWPTRNRIYIENAVDLLQQTAMRCLERADIDALVVASTTGIATPSLDALLIERMAMRRDVRRLPIFGLGCAGGVVGLARAADVARAHPGSKVLFLVVELCALTFRLGDLSPSNIVASALFGDGAGGVILSTECDGPGVTASGEHSWRNSLDVMGWKIEEDGLGVLFSRDIPNLVRKRFRPALEEFLRRSELEFSEIDEFVCHPGGVKVIEALEESLDMQNGTMRHARSVLRDYGNMSAATVLFVLERSLEQVSSGNRLLSSLGPGFTAGFLALAA